MYKYYNKNIKLIIIYYIDFTCVPVCVYVCTAGVDAELRDPQVLLEPGASSVSAEIAIISDGLLENFIERFFVEIVSVSDGEIGQRFNATVIIFDQDSKSCYI